MSDAVRDLKKATEGMLSRGQVERFEQMLDAQATEDARAAIVALSKALTVLAQIPGGLSTLRRAIDRAEARVRSERAATVPNPHTSARAPVGGSRR